MRWGLCPDAGQAIWADGKIGLAFVWVARKRVGRILQVSLRRVSCTLRHTTARLLSWYPLKSIFTGPCHQIWKQDELDKGLHHLFRVIRCFWWCSQVIMGKDIARRSLILIINLRWQGDRSNNLYGSNYKYLKNWKMIDDDRVLPSLSNYSS